MAGEAVRTGHEDEAEDWDEGASDGYVPSDLGDAEDQEFHQYEKGDDDQMGEERRGVSEDVVEEVSSTIKARARRNSRRMKKSQPKASDYSEEVESLLNHGLGFMRAMVVSEKPMPSVDESIELAADAFKLAKSDRPTVETPPDLKYISILRRAIPQVRGKIKDAARARAGDTYGFDDRPRMEQKNRRRYLSLVEQDAYTYEKPESFQGPYYHPLCYKILKTCFFSKTSDDGVAHSGFFSPINPETIALIFTAIRMSLDEWKTGSYKPLTFTSDIYEPIYQVHLANLKALEEEDPDFVKGLGEELWEDCR
ncbi:hypothetical protein M407DRAFT_78474 [Tulasnella calospora MUT 4182]|uniref:DUF6532 domain-containing protein n=1 Tax=Tulasnella calospora MUT 4182 TaxID=1051891 RepID=A0A0C3LNZ2_9AGAM|nr:hypothetical protein M407DRAFT_78474 [Tulasnella calospora MUT 4182]